MVRRQFTNLLERFVGLLVPSLAEQPKRALVQEEATDEEQASGDELDAHGDPPGGSLGRVHVLVDAVVDPEADNTSDLIGELEQAGQDAADRGDGELGNVTGDCGSNRTTAKSREDAAGICESQVSLAYP